MANQTRKRLLALALALCLALGMLLPAGRVNAEGQSAGILTEVTGEERERLASLADDALALEEPSEEAPGGRHAGPGVHRPIGQERPGARLRRLCRGGSYRLYGQLAEPAGGGDPTN